MQILCVGHDKLLLQTRGLVLERHFHVELATSLRGLTDLAGEKSFDLVVLCHTLSWRERFLASEMVSRHWPGTKVVEMLAMNDSEPAGASTTGVRSMDGPAKLVAIAHQLLGRVASNDQRPQRSTGSELGSRQGPATEVVRIGAGAATS